MFFEMVDTKKWSGGGIGRHVALKMPFPLECRFDSGPDYKRGRELEAFDVVPASYE